MEFLVAMAIDDAKRHAAPSGADTALCGRPVLTDIDHPFDPHHKDACPVCALGLVVRRRRGEAAP